MGDNKGKKGGQRMAAAGVAGALVGASVGAATAWALSDQKNRKKIGDTVKNMKVYAGTKMKEAGKKMDSRLHDKIDDAVDTSAEKIKATEDILSHSGEDIQKN